MIELNVNGAIHRLDADADAPLMWVLREKLGLTSVKFGCGVGVCGACTVHIDGVAQRSCTVPLDIPYKPLGSNNAYLNVVIANPA